MLPWQPIFDRQKIESSFLKLCFWLTVVFLYWFLLLFVQFRRFPEVLEKSRNPRRGIQDGRHLQSGSNYGVIPFLDQPQKTIKARSRQG